jgi:acyl-CoA synthetase (AMP-forming)/AMP-acid ligase II
MKILHEQQVRSNLAELDRAWSVPETFIFLPEKSAAGEAWIAERLAGIPRDYAEGHFILLTSGTTGEPKLVIGSRDRAEALARHLHERQDSEAVQATVCLLPLTYCYAFVNQWRWARSLGRDLVMTDGFSRPAELETALASTPASMICLVGAQLPLFHQHFPDATFPLVQRVHFAGGRFPQEHLADLALRFPSATIYNNYGCAEAMPRLTLRKADEADDAADVGRPLDGVKLRLDGAGELTFQSPFSAVAFMDEQGFSAVPDTQWISTGDLAEEHPNGHWRVLGRSGEVFKRYGEKISLSSLLKSVGEVWPHAAAFYKAHDPGGEEAHVLSLAPHPDKKEVREILLRFRKDFPRTHWPLRIESAAQLPVLPNGKTDILALPTLADKQEHWRQRL